MNTYSHRTALCTSNVKVHKSGALGAFWWHDFCVLTVRSDLKGFLFTECVWLVMAMWSLSIIILSLNGSKVLQVFDFVCMCFAGLTHLRKSSIERLYFEFVGDSSLSVPYGIMMLCFLCVLHWYTEFLNLKCIRSVQCHLERCSSWKFYFEL